MKNHFCLFTVIFLLSIPLVNTAQNISKDGWTFSFQYQIDEFPANHPGETSLQGGLSIQGNNITNLDSLIQITTITGDLLIDNCDTLIDISGLSNVEYINGIDIKNNRNLKSINCFDKVTSLEGSINIYANDSLTYISSLQNLTHIGGSFTIKYNDLLTDLPSFPYLVEIGGNMDLSNINEIENLQCFQYLTKIGRNLTIINNLSLIDLTGLQNIDSLNYLQIMWNPSLRSLEGLQQIKTSSSGINISTNDTLQNIAFNHVKRSRQIYIASNKNLINMNFDSMEVLEDNLYITNNSKLQSIETFNQLDSVKRIDISDNQTLENINGFHKLKEIVYQLNIEFNDSLTNLSGFQNLNSINHIIIKNNEKLHTFSGFDILDTIKGDLTMMNNDDLTAFDAFNNLKHINGEFYIFDGNFTSFNNLSNLSSIGSNLKLIKISS
ncbi:MAG: hypothetical protein GQ527_10495, partial [Bacteroidales bacterium]|nr:hypothetical protein [Bacteroidales bacterium]